MASHNRGMTFIEVLVGMFVAGFAIITVMTFIGTALSNTSHNVDKQFATQKAISMLEELKSLVQVAGNSATLLDSYDDDNNYVTVLTTDPAVTAPDDKISGNISIGSGAWKYRRRVSISLLPGTDDQSARLVNVKVYGDKDKNGTWDILAEVAGVVRTPLSPFPITQSYDVYAIAAENVPGWWVYMSNLIPFVQSAVQDLETRNPGLDFRVHWITKLAYGRDQQYRPYVNKTSDSNQPVNYVYFYPGMMPSGSASDYYYPPNNFSGHVLLDSTDKNGYDATNNPNPYSLADMYNNAMRYPDELALFNARVASGQESDDSPTLRILLERMFKDPFKYRNAILINLHGELMPFPPVRNYSDAAKEPVNFNGIRAVTHPEYLHYTNTSATVKLRVYSYRTDPDITGLSANQEWLGQPSSAIPITVTLKGVTWAPTSGTSDIKMIQGGTDQDGTSGADRYSSSNATTTAVGNRMYYTSTTSGGDTIISLFNSPLKSPEVTSGGHTRGVRTAERLYGLEYIPAPVEDLTLSASPPTPFSLNFTADHTVSGGVCSGTCNPNTARWIITIPQSVLPGGTNGSGMLTVETRIDSTTSGTRTDEPPNLSRTYVWKGTDAWLFGDGTSANLPNLPITEQYQFLGDPRHCPYADLKMPHASSGLPDANVLGMGYNRYFDDFEDSGGGNNATSSHYPGWSYTVSGSSYGIKNDGSNSNDGWDTGNGMVEIDMNRVYQVLRKTLNKSRSVFTTMTGFSFFYVGIGNEIGYDSANGFANSIPVSSKLFTGGTGTTYEQTILPSSSCSSAVTNGCGVKYIRSNASGNYWWGINWLGELYPDSAYSGGSGWAATGNLPTGTGATNFIRTLRENISPDLPSGTTFLSAGHRTAERGSTAFFWTGAANSTFHHIYSDGGTGDLQTAGSEVSTGYNYPLSSGIPINRPFNYNVNDTGSNPDHFLQTPYGSTLTSNLESEFYDQSPTTSAYGSALVSEGDSSFNADFVVVNGIAMTGMSGSSFISNWSMLSLIQSFMTAGRYNAANSYTNHIEQLPRVTITSPNYSTNMTDPSTINVGWSREWLRWDGQLYTSAYSGGYSETSAVSYTVMYSSDNGATWHYMQDDSVATVGVRPASGTVLISTASATPSYTWSTPSGSFPQGSYLIRVEAYRDALPLHYSSHQYRAFIRRTS